MSVLFKKILALFTVVRGYNVFVLVVALYVAGFFLFSDTQDIRQFLQDPALHLMVLASACTISGGYIINNFYDAQRDALSRPIYVYIARFVGQNVKLWVYLALNFLGLIFAFIVSWRVWVFFVVYMFLVWFYSHKINKWVLVNNFAATILTLMPFLALLIHFNNYALIIFYHAIFLFLLLFTTDITKDLVTYKADLLLGYHTMATHYGISIAKKVVSVLLGITAFWAYQMTFKEQMGMLGMYYYLCIFLLILLAIVVHFLHRKWQYGLFNLFLRIIIALGVVSIVWIKINPLDLQRIF